MKTVFVLLLLLLGIGIFARAYNTLIRLLLIVVIGGMVLFVALT